MTRLATQLQQWQDKIHTQNVNMGWWDNVPEEEIERMQLIVEKMQLISTEIAEATEGARKNLMDDHLPHRKMEEVELADALIRTLDLTGFKYFIWQALEDESEEGSFEEIVNFMEIGYNRDCSRVATGHFSLNVALVKSLEDGDLGLLVLMIIAWANHRGYDIMKAMSEKVEYNANRADHKRENREKEGGKNF